LGYCLQILEEESNMHNISEILPKLIQASVESIVENAELVTTLDQVLGDGDHVINLQRGLHALQEQQETYVQLDWPGALQKIGMTLLGKMGGASGSLFGTLFMSLGKALGEEPVTQQTFAVAFNQAVDMVKKRGKSGAGEKTMLDVLIPVADCLENARANASYNDTLQAVAKAAITGMESTQDMLATKGRASFLGERSIGHIDAGAKTSQLIICAVVAVLLATSTTPA
jgi:dihydroxyacetone kinase-like protein